MSYKIDHKCAVEDWNRYVDNKGLAHHAYYHQWSEIVEKTFGHSPRYLAIRNDSAALSGIAPLFEFKSSLFGNSLISVPYLNAGGIIADSVEAHQLLREEACRIADECGAEYVELRHEQSSDFYPETAQLRTHKVTMALQLDPDPDEVFSGFKSKLRSQIRRPEKSNCSSQSYQASDPQIASAITDFYAVFSENMRDLGTPVYPKSLFLNTMQAFGDRARLFVVYAEDGTPAAAGLTVGAGTLGAGTGATDCNSGSSVEILWASSLRKFNRESPNMMLYWEAIRQACLDGYSEFDFGRTSPDSGTYRFKKQWGAKPRQLHWYYLNAKSELPDVNPDNPKFRFLVNCWQRIPLVVANCIGPKVARHLP